MKSVANGSPLNTWIGAKALTCSVLFFLAGCTKNDGEFWSGYTMADFVMVASPIGGRVNRFFVSAGDHVEVGEPLFELDNESELAQRDELQAKLKNVIALEKNLEKGKRELEINVIEAQLKQASSQMRYAKQALSRAEQNHALGGVSQSELDAAINSSKQADEKLKELESSLSVAKLPAREDEILAALATVDATKQALHQSQWALDQKTQKSKVVGMVHELFYRPGEYAQSSQVVLSILPASNVKVRFFVKEKQLPSIEVGQPVLIDCDGCGASLAAKITRISAQAEYTPPVIYSNTERSELVFMVEAYPSENDAKRLRAGQPVQVRPNGVMP